MTLYAPELWEAMHKPPQTCPTVWIWHWCQRLLDLEMETLEVETLEVETLEVETLAAESSVESRWGQLLVRPK